MSETSSERDVSPEAVTRRVDHVIQDALDGRLTKPQRAAVRSAVDRAERVTLQSDSAIGRISQGESS